MKLPLALSLTLCVLLVPLPIDCQWNYYTRSPPSTRYTPMVRANVVRRFGVVDSSNGSPAQTRPVPTAPATRAPPAPVTPGPSGLAVLPENDVKIAHMVLDFTMRMSRTLAQPQSKTELFSPISIVTVANLLFLGSQGVTHEEFGKVLTPAGMNWKNFQQRYSSVLANLLTPEPIDSRRDPWRRQSCPHDNDDDDYQEAGSSTPAPRSTVIRLANGVFYQKSLRLRSRYVDVARNFFGALVQPLDPQNGAGSTAMINQWVSDVTAGKIRNMLDGPLSPSSSVVIANALYFKGKWKTQFEPMVTRDAAFFPDGYDGASFRVKMMATTGCFPFYRVRDALDVSIVGLPYRDNTTTMYLIQPGNSSVAAVRRLQASLTGKTLDSWIGQMKLQSTMVRLPKMDLRSTVDLLQSFQKLGFTSILSPAKSDLSAMVEQGSGVNGQRPYVNQIRHKVHLTIDEEGTEGAAATSALVDRIGTQQSFNGNTPFLVYLRHDATGMPLFYGPIFDPR